MLYTRNNCHYLSSLVQMNYTLLLNHYVFNLIVTLTTDIKTKTLMGEHKELIACKDNVLCYR